MPAIDLSILNQRQTPAFYADVFANRPAAGFVGRIFVSTNTFAFYRDNGTGWDLIGGPGTGTITGSGTAGTIPLWSGASTIADSDLRQLSSEALILNSSTNDWPSSNFANDAGRFLITSATNNPLLVLWGKSAFGSGDEQGSIALGNVSALGSTNFGGAILDGSIENGTDGSGQLTIKTTNTAGTETLALKIDSTQKSTFYNDIILSSGAATKRLILDANVNVARIFSIRTNNLPRWAVRVDGTESGTNAGSDFAIRRYDDTGAFVDAPLTITRSTGQSTFAKKVIIENNAGDQQLQIVSTTAPSLRIDNLQTGATKRIGLGLATNVNNFIQGSVDRDFCVFNSSTTASPILFGIYDAGLTNTQEAARISPARNFLIGTITDSGEKLIVNGAAKISSSLLVNGVGDFNTSTSSVYDFAIRNTGTGNTRLRLGNSTSTARLTITLGATGSEFARIGPEGNFPLYLQTNGADRLAISGNGNVAIDNVNSYLAKLNVANISSGSVTRGLSLFNNAGDVSGTGISIEFYPNAGNDDRCARISSNNTATGLYADLRFSTANAALTAEAMRITPGGNLLIGTTTDAGDKLQVQGGIVSYGTTASGIFFQDRSGSAITGFYTTTGLNVYTSASGIVGIFNLTTGVYTPTSDKNKKKNFEQSNFGLDAVLKLKPTLYNMINQNNNEAKELGFIAQEVKEVIEQAYVENGEFIGLNYQPIVATLVKAIQELNQKIENLK